MHTLEKAHKTIRSTLNLKESKHNCYFSDSEIDIVLTSIGFSKTCLPKWWRKTKAGIKHPGKYNSNKILELLEKKKSPTQDKPFEIKSIEHLQKWILVTLAHQLPSNTTALHIDTDSNYKITVEIDPHA